MASGAQNSIVRPGSGRLKFSANSCILCGMAKQWRCAVIGTSTVGHTHVKVLSQLENTKVVAVCDLNPEKAKAALERHGITGVPIYKDQLEMHAKHQLDVVNIATPSGVH